jgi:hypothetical protein
MYVTTLDIKVAFSGHCTRTVAYDGDAMQQATSHKYNLLCTSLWPVSLHSPAVVVRRSFTQKLSVVHQQKRQETLPLLILK